MSIKWLNTAIFLYLGGHMWFALTAVFTDGWDGTTAYEKYYFLWNDFAGCGLLVWLLLYLSVKTYRGTILPVLIFSIFNFVWDIFAFTTDWGMNHPVMTGIFFGAGALTVLYFMVKDIIRRWKS